ncbi:hypothetical protein ACWCYY_31145 [Kitasatospora sp. NPDC001664]
MERLELRYDRTTVAHWLSGSRPTEPVPRLVAEVLSRSLGREVSVEDTGLGRPVVRPAAPDGDPYELMVALAALGGRRRPDRLPVYSLARKRLPAFPQQAPHGRSAVPPARIGTPHLQLAQSLLEVVASRDEAMGPEQGRGMLTDFLGTVAADWLRASAPPALRWRLLSCTSRLSYLAGFSCFDAQHHGLAQSYYRTAALLAAEAADNDSYAIALRGMSVQAHYLGHRRYARELAELAATHGHALPAGQAAFVRGQQAVTAAACGERKKAFAYLTEAQRLLDRALTPSSGVGGYDWAGYAHQEAEVLAGLGDVQGAIRSLTRSGRERSATERMARAVVNARLAELLLSRGSLDRATEVWHSVLDDYPLVGSGRLTASVTRMRGRLALQHRGAAVQALLNRAAALQGAVPARRKPVDEPERAAP